MEGKTQGGVLDAASIGNCYAYILSIDQMMAECYNTEVLGQTAGRGGGVTSLLPVANATEGWECAYRSVGTAGQDGRF